MRRGAARPLRPRAALRLARRPRSTTCGYPLETLRGRQRTAPARPRPRRRDKGARFLLASTSEVYGDPLVHPQREDYWGNVNPVGPAQPVRRGQALRRGADHRLPRRARRRHRHRAASSTPTARGCAPTTAGPCRPSSRQALAGEPLTVAGDGTPDAVTVLRRRHRRRRAAGGREPLGAAGEHRRERRGDGPGDRREGRGTDRLPLDPRLRRPPGGRPGAQATRHRARP